MLYDKLKLVFIWTRNLHHFLPIINKLPTRFCYKSFVKVLCIEYFFFKVSFFLLCLKYICIFFVGLSLTLLLTTKLSCFFMHFFSP